jgi:hypothetical protein
MDLTSVRNSLRAGLVAVLAVLASRDALRELSAEVQSGSQVRSDAPSTRDEQQTIRLKNGDPEKVVRLLREAFAAPSDKRRPPANPASPKPGAPGSIPPPPALEIQIDPIDRSILLRGAAEPLAFARSFLEEFDRAPDSPLLLEKFALEHRSATDMAKVLDELFNCSTRPASAPSGPAPWVPHEVRTFADPVRASVLIAGGKDEMALIPALLSELDQPAAQELAVRVHRLHYASPARVKWMVEALFGKPRSVSGPIAAPVTSPPVETPRDGARPERPPASAPPAEVSVAEIPQAAAVLVKAPTEVMPTVLAFILGIDTPSGQLPQATPIPPRQNLSPGTGPGGRPRPHH